MMVVFLGAPVELMPRTHQLVEMLSPHDQR